VPRDPVCGITPGRISRGSRVRLARLSTLCIIGVDSGQRDGRAFYVPLT
jgi:hypothetical protein